MLDETFSQEHFNATLVQVEFLDHLLITFKST